MEAFQRFLNGNWKYVQRTDLGKERMAFMQRYKRLNQPDMYNLLAFCCLSSLNVLTKNVNHVLVISLVIKQLIINIAASALRSSSMLRGLCGSLPGL